MKNYLIFIVAMLALVAVFVALFLPLVYLISK